MSQVTRSAAGSLGSQASKRRVSRFSPQVDDAADASQVPNGILLGVSSVASANAAWRRPRVRQARGCANPAVLHDPPAGT